jgi:hypothetical protein
MTPAKLQPALLAGVAIGVLSALPVVNVGNLCCCAWVVCGGVRAAYLMQQNHPAPIAAGDGALVGLMAGALGALVAAALSLVVAVVIGPFQSQVIDWVLNGNRNLPPEVRQVFEEMRGGVVGGALAGVGFIIGTIFSLVMYSIFGLLGGLLGAVLFRKQGPPLPPAPLVPPVPPTGGFTPATFTPPPPFEPPPPPAG